jgi:uncharacterized protein with FMN-binding domain
MRRVVLTLGGTIAGLAALLSFKTHSLAGVSAIDAQGTPTAPATAPPAAPTSSPPATAPQTTGTAASSAKRTSAPPATSGAAGATPTGSAAGKKTSAGTPTPTPTSAATRTVTGTVASTPYGPMQVQVTLAGTRITKVTVLQQTNDGAESGQIDSFAIPTLTAETLTVQSARIDTVSGATSTSAGYIQSLQSALDKA